MDHIPEDIDICVCTDLEEVFSPGWRECVEHAWTPEATSGRYLYNWSLHPDGTPDVQFNYFKIHIREGLFWRHPVHECLIYRGDKPAKQVKIEDVVLTHYPDPSKTRGSYLPLLELAVQEEPDSDRAAHYLGREYFYKGMWDKAIAELKRHLSLKSAIWAEERCASMRLIAKCLRMLGDNASATKWYYMAIAESPGIREPYVEFAQMGYETGDWALTLFMAEEALKILEKSPTYVNMGYAWDATPEDLAAIAAYRMGLYDRSLMHAKNALQLTPNDGRLKRNYELILEKASETARRD
jgi:tetratricopeptide (TPR) repeat protein